MARIYSNENFPIAVVLSLRAAGHEALTSSPSITGILLRVNRGQ